MNATKRNLTVRLLTVLAFAGGVVFSSCRTVEGFGEDVQEVGSEIEEAAH